MSNRASFPTDSLEKQRPKVLFFGMQGNFSTPSLLALLEQCVDVCAVILPATSIPGRETLPVQRREQPKRHRIALPLLTMSMNPSIVDIAWREQIPVWDVYRLSNKESYDVLASYQPDMICVACFSQRIPRTILDLPRFGCLNVHPSLLPANRGPEPLFWTFREGHNTTGVTIHQMNEGMDSGDIFVQESIAVPDGIRYEQLEWQCAQLGGTLLAQTVWNVYNGKATRIHQDEMKSSYHSLPMDKNLIVHAEEWDARHVYNFIQGVGRWNGPIRLYEHGRMLLVEDAISYSLDNVIHDNSHEQGIIISCKTGFIKIKSL